MCTLRFHEYTCYSPYNHEDYELNVAPEDCGNSQCPYKQTGSRFDCKRICLGEGDCSEHMGDPYDH